jgi:hypothetical protein
MRSRRVATPFVEAELTKGEYHNEARSQPGMSAISVLLNLLWILFGGLWMAAGWLIAAIVMAADHRTWAEDGSESRDLCNHPKVELDAWCQRLRGCVQCNQWMNFYGEWQRLPEQDIAALRGLTSQRPQSLESS